VACATGTDGDCVLRIAEGLRGESFSATGTGTAARVQPAGAAATRCDPDVERDSGRVGSNRKRP
jgi:hypothetical protein